MWLQVLRSSFANGKAPGDLLANANLYRFSSKSLKGLFRERFREMMVSYEKKLSRRGSDIQCPVR